MKTGEYQDGHTPLAKLGNYGILCIAGTELVFYVGEVHESALG
jgi:hypothetical protein